MEKHLDFDTIERELRLAFLPPLELSIEYSDHVNKMRFQVLGQDEEVLYYSPPLPIRGIGNIRLPRHFKFHVLKARKMVEKKTGIELPSWKLPEK